MASTDAVRSLREVVHQQFLSITVLPIQASLHQRTICTIVKMNPRLAFALASLFAGALSAPHAGHDGNKDPSIGDAKFETLEDAREYAIARNQQHRDMAVSNRVTGQPFGPQLKIRWKERFPNSPVVLCR